MGIAGAGYATVLANWASALFGAYLLFKNKHEVSYRVRSAWRWNKDPSPSLHSLRSAERPPMGARGSGIHQCF